MPRPENKRTDVGDYLAQRLRQDLAAGVSRASVISQAEVDKKQLGELLEKGTAGPGTLLKLIWYYFPDPKSEGRQHFVERFHIAYPGHRKMKLPEEPPTRETPGLGLDGNLEEIGRVLPYVQSSEKRSGRWRLQRIATFLLLPLKPFLGPRSSASPRKHLVPTAVTTGLVVVSAFIVVALSHGPQHVHSDAPSGQQSDDVGGSRPVLSHEAGQRGTAKDAPPNQPPGELTREQVVAEGQEEATELDLSRASFTDLYRLVDQPETKACLDFVAVYEYTDEHIDKKDVLKKDVVMSSWPGLSSFKDREGVLHRLTKIRVAFFTKRQSDDAALGKEYYCCLGGKCGNALFTPCSYNPDVVSLAQHPLPGGFLGYLVPPDPKTGDADLVDAPSAGHRKGMQVFGKAGHHPPGTRPVRIDYSRGGGLTLADDDNLRLDVFKGPDPIIGYAWPPECPN
ncbi:MAG: hypothetical protein UT86_C0001G0225 [Candidatus Magasanikbacteria bacterium GW2011_GWC2_40_17]|uniref:Uncharacterized protein n=1 Tax=Candidatus Magasanikbacteria bacterium GW2011_GWA2_42_32 TaxID=1619039 RepID=A0A0G1A997_9BACT|nr:MAG: hypothetical protein UT86_C0001G0225 [Candidatus Magasanikbacteria bacterium GW2011_GWC2_40_17]KKS57585.1 MAG: hypothetical protein UV20_C0001G0225 [Candidatus Magasanikbacteria bacterium GW2011_GWA2_42_32]OGH85460.1 MAG: hypothetical protein A2294_03585 [Candidatus Magasanikbacteria bacterium RIFOXYB2_FULL_38_10]